MKRKIILGYFAGLLFLACWNLIAIPMDALGLESEIGVALEEANQSEESALEGEACSVMMQLGFTEEATSNLNQCVKELQHAQSPTPYTDTSSIIWNNSSQEFETLQQNNGNNSDADIGSDNDIVSVLNAYLNEEKSKFRLDAYPWKVQDATTPRLLSELRLSDRNAGAYSLVVAHNKDEQKFLAVTKPSLAPKKGVIAFKETPEKRDFLLFGFDVPDKNGPREIFQKKLESDFSHIALHTVNQWNNALGIVMVRHGSTPFNQYLKFIIDAKQQGKLASHAAGVNGIEPHIQSWAKEWATFLEQNIQRISFSQKLSSPSKRVKFLIKNCNPSMMLSSKPWECSNNREQSIAGYFEPVFTLLANVGIQLISEDLNSQQLEQVRQNLEEQSKFLNCSLSRRRDLQLVLNDIVMKAFFRRTSKLALDFARSRNMKVVFVWKLPSFTAASNQVAATTLKDLHDYVDKKPYYQLQFRQVGGRQFPKAITCSEIDHLTRRKKSSEAPDYLLLRGILPPNTESASSSFSKK